MVHDRDVGNADDGGRPRSAPSYSEQSSAKNRLPAAAAVMVLIIIVIAAIVGPAATLT